MSKNDNPICPECNTNTPVEAVAYSPHTEGVIHSILFRCPECEEEFSFRNKTKPQIIASFEAMRKN